MKRKSVVFNCFSPPVMLATFIIEIVLATYTAVRYKLTAIGRLSVVMLVALGLFQLCEYHVCGGWGVRASEWSRLGYVAITLLPPLGLHLLYVVVGKTGRRLVWTAYATMFGFVAYFLALPHVFQGYACTGNYVIFQIGMRPALVYGLYYYGWILTMFVLGIRWAKELKKVRDQRARNLGVQVLLLGYLVFLVPTALANSVKPETRQGIPSIMCGFAVLFAFILTLYILPKLGERRALFSGRKAAK